MFRNILFLLLLPFLVSAESPTGTLQGTVVYLGEVPATQKIPTTDGGFIFHNDLVVERTSKGLRYVAVLVEGKGPASKPVPKEPLIIDQRDMIFQPRVTAVREGQKVRFENNDLCNHAVQASSTLPVNTFNVTTPQGQPFEHQFKAQKHPILIGCPIHPWMRAYIYVLPHPGFAVTDGQGRFTIPDLPAGKHEVTFLHPDTGLKEKRTVTIEPGKTTELKLEWTGRPEK